MKNKPRISIIVAHSTNLVIGNDNSLPWRIANDLKHFKELTVGKPVVMGRKTYESIGFPLPNRMNIIISRNKSFNARDITTAHTIEDAVNIAHDHCDGDEIMIIGGEQIYRHVMPIVDRIYLTLVDTDIDGDAHFPTYDMNNWSETSRESFSADDLNQYDYSFITLDRIQ